METINFGIIGCGAVSEKHGQATRQVEGVRLVAAADVVEERARAFAAKYCEGPPRIYTDYRRMLEDPDVDAVIIATPSGLHARMGLDALDAGKHVLIEKPLALTSEDAGRLIEKATHVKKCLGTVHPNRYYPTSQMIYRAIREGRLGKLSHGVATVRWSRPQSYYEEAPWRKTKEMDGGVLFNQAWHALDMLFWYIGSPAVEVQGMTARRLHDVETEDVAFLTVRFQNGALGLLEATTNVYPRNLEHTISVFAETGTIVQGGTRPDTLKVWRVRDEAEQVVIAEWGETRSIQHPDAWAHGKVLMDFQQQIETTNVACEIVNDARNLIAVVEKVTGIQPGSPM